jgi:Ca2+-binding RTX toxin-like protein
VSRLLFKGCLAAGGAMVTLALIASSASATVTCTTDDFGRPGISIAGQGETVAVRVTGAEITYDPGANGDAFLPCGATVFSTDTIFVGGEPGTGQGLLIDLSGGQFAPGFSTAGDPGVPEIEWSVNLFGGSRYIPDFLWVKGGEGADGLLAAGSGDAGVGGVTQGLELNWSTEEMDLDVAFPGPIPEVIKLRGEGGPDHISTSAGGPGQPYLNPAYLLQIEGGPGEDSLQGTQRRNTHSSCRRQNLFVRLTFDAGSRNKHYECLIGGDEHDVLRGQNGEDRLLGQGARDYLYGGQDDDFLNGGDGNDLCNTGGGRDATRSCED